LVFGDHAKLNRDALHRLEIAEIIDKPLIPSVLNAPLAHLEEV